MTNPLKKKKPPEKPQNNLQKLLETHRKQIMVLSRENEHLKTAVRSEQEARVDQLKDIMELEISLKSSEEEIIKSQQEKYQLYIALDRVTNQQSQLFSKIKESEEVLSTCTTFLEKNGLVQTSFLSDDQLFPE